MARYTKKTADQKKREVRLNQTYKRNPKLKKSGVELELTTEQIAELKRCATDVDYFCEKYVKIVHVDRGEVPYKAYPYQQKIMHESILNRFVICKLPRQSGKTTAMVALLLWFVLFSPNFIVAILANKSDTARKILSRLKYAYERLPFWMQQGVVEWNKGSIELENASKIVASSTSSSAVRGDSYNLIYLDEFAFVDNNMQEEFFASVYPTISSGDTTRVLITSTPRGLNMFYKMWMDAIDKKSQYVPIAVHWTDTYVGTRKRDEEWKKEQIANSSEQQFAVEFECEFVGSMNTLISPIKLRAIPAIRPQYFQGEHLAIYEEPQPGHTYTLVCDSSQGTGNDFSAFPVIDITDVPYKVVAVYRNNKIAAVLYPEIIHQAAKSYNDAFVLVETNDIGMQVATILQQELEYEHVLMSQWRGRKGQVLGTGFGDGEQCLGVRTTQPVKRIGSANIKTIIESDRMIINDFNILSELSTYVVSKRGNGFEADVGCNDDLVMSLVLFGWMTQQDYFKELTNIDIRKNLSDANQQAVLEETLAFAITEDGNDTGINLEGEDEFSAYGTFMSSYDEGEEGGASYDAF